MLVGPSLHLCLARLSARLALVAPVAAPPLPCPSGRLPLSGTVRDEAAFLDSERRGRAPRPPRSPRPPEGGSAQPAASLSDGRVLITGGYANALTSAALDSAEIYNPATRKFSSAGSMTHARIGHVATLIQDGRILIVGGSSAVDAEAFDPVAGVFGPAGSMSQARWGPTATALPDGRVLIAGGYDQATSHSLATAELWEP